MAEEQKRRKKVTGAAKHRTGTYRAAVKPGTSGSATEAEPSSGAASGSTSGVTAAVSSAAAANPHKQLIENFMASLPTGTLSQAVWGAALSSQASAVRKMFGLAETDEPYLYLGLSSSGGGLSSLLGGCRGGIVLSSSGFHMQDGRGDSADVAWSDFKRIAIGVQQNTLLIGTVAIMLQDNQALAALLTQLQAF